MSKDKNQWWVIKAPSGDPSVWGQNRSKLIYHFSAGGRNFWRRLRKTGFRCVKVWVYKEQRIRRPVADPVAGIIHHSPREGDYR